VGRGRVAAHKLVAVYRVGYLKQGLGYRAAPSPEMQGNCPMVESSVEGMETTASRPVGPCLLDSTTLRFPVEDPEVSRISHVESEQ
jgi:hypothetical protein